MPSVATDLIIKTKFLKLPIKAMPDVPRKTEIILEEKMPKTKLTATEIELSDNTFKSVFCFKIFNLDFLSLVLEFRQLLHFRGCFS